MFRKYGYRQPNRSFSKVSQSLIHSMDVNRDQQLALDSPFDEKKANNLQSRAVVKTIQTKD